MRQFRALIVIIGLLIGGLSNVAYYFLFQPPSLAHLNLIDRLPAGTNVRDNYIELYVRQDRVPYKYSLDWPQAHELENAFDAGSGERVQLWVDGDRQVWQVAVKDRQVVSYSDTSDYVRERRWTDLWFGMVMVCASIIAGVGTFGWHYWQMS